MDCSIDIGQKLTCWNLVLRCLGSGASLRLPLEPDQAASSEVGELLRTVSPDADFLTLLNWVGPRTTPPPVLSSKGFT